MNGMKADGTDKEERRSPMAIRILGNILSISVTVVVHTAGMMVVSTRVDL